MFEKLVLSQKEYIKRFFVKIVGLFSFIALIFGFIADMETLKPKIKIIIKNVFNTNDYFTIMIIFIITSLIVLIWSLVWLWFDSKRKDAGIRGAACSTKWYIRYKLFNKSNTLLRNVHVSMYHKLKELIIGIRKKKDELNKNNTQKRNLVYQEYSSEISNFLSTFQEIIRDTFKLDLSIILYISGKENRDDEDELLKRWIFIRNKDEISNGEYRPAEQDNEKEKRYIRYIIRPCNKKELSDYAENAKHFQKNDENGNYWTNSIFDYLMTSDNNYFISNDLENDERNNEFYTTNVYYKKNNDDKRVRSLAAFAVIPPPSNDREKSIVTKGILTFDSNETNVFSCEECKMLMGLMAHYIYEILYEINN